MSTPEDIAVIGVGCRFPGATCLQEFWDVLSRGENHVTDIPPDRWNADTFHDPHVETVGKSYSRKGGFIKNYAHFDNKLFGINESEAAQMDPQQRHVLECTYMALENAGITRKQISGQKVGVFIGAMNSDFTVRMTSNSHDIDNYSVAGLAGSVIANRVSYVYNLSGPSMVIDTACSSSLVALHQSGLALRSGDCNMAICGGVNLMLHPTVYVPLCKARMLSPTGQCHAFSAAADGYTRGEGCGIVILKPLKQALKDGDNIWGTVMTGVNQDGRAAQPITAPAGNQQMALLNKIYTVYKVDPSTVEYIEAHGTGTKLGDPVEVKAFGEFFAEQSQTRQRYIGSVKTNIGHLEPAAGVAGLIKVLLMMKHNTIVPSLHFEKPNELIDFEKYEFVVPVDRVPWKSADKVACINSFGFGGTNSHAIVRQYIKDSQKRKSCSSGSRIVCFSSCTLRNLKESLEVFHSTDTTQHSLKSLSFTSTVRREHFAVRKAFVVTDKNDLRNQVEEYINKADTSNENRPTAHLIFVFGGMGTAWKGMCNILIGRYSIFRSSLMLIEAHLQTHVPWSLTKRLLTGHNVDDPMFGPIAIFACQVALARLWESLGVKAAVVVGQSVGEVAAAHIAGVLPLEEAVRVIYYRTQILAQVTEGKMLLVRNTNIKHVQYLCQEIGNLEISLHYSPVACAVSGKSSAVEELKTRLGVLQEKDKMLFMVELEVTSAFHSYYMEPVQKQLDKTLTNIKTFPPTISMISTVDPAMTTTELMSHSYWGMNVRKPVQFSEAIKKSVSDEFNIFIEIGPKPVLGSHLEDIFNTSDADVMSLPSLTAKTLDVSLLKSISTLYEHKMDIKWDALFTKTEPASPVPSYVFSHKHLMVLPPITEEEVFGSQSNCIDHLFVKQFSSRYRLSITPSMFATVYEHKVQGIIVVPGATYTEAGFGIGKVLNIGGVGNLSVSVKFSNPVTLKKDCPLHLDVDVENTSANFAKTFRIRHGEVLHAQGCITRIDNQESHQRMDIQMIKERCPEMMDRDRVYQVLKYSGFTYGDSFATIEYALKGKSENFTKLKVGPRIQEEMKLTVIHPAVLDGMLQSAAATDVQEREFLPVELKNVIVYQSMESEMFVVTRMTEWTDSHTSFTMTLLSTNGTVIAKVGRFTTKCIASECFDEQSTTFKTALLKLETMTPTTGCDEDGVIIFTDANLKDLKKPWVVHPLDHMGAEGTRSQLDSVSHKVSLICFIFPLNKIPYTDGTEIQDDLVRRIMSLRLIVLYLANKMPSVPLVVISELGKLESSTGKECAGYCLHEAVKGFVRCVLREYRSLSVQLVDMVVDNGDTFINYLSRVVDTVRQKDMMMYPEIQFHNDEISMHTILPYPISPPSYRTALINDAAVLCSESKRSIKQPFFHLQHSYPEVSKDEVDITLTSITVHNAFLTAVTVNTESHSNIHPVLCLEGVGKVMTTSGRGSQAEILTCFPTQVCRTIRIPRSCTVSRNNIPGYTPGCLTKMYVMWSLCGTVGKNHVAILQSKSTTHFAKALSCMLQSLGARSVSFIKPDELEAVSLAPCVALISTIRIAKDLTLELLKQCGNLKTVTLFESISSQDTLDSLHWCRSSLQVHVIRQDVFSQKTMLQEVPKLLKWIRSHHKSVCEIIKLLNSYQNEIQPTPTISINLTEVLQTTEVKLRPGDSIDCCHMRTRSHQLFQKQGSYLVVGGLTGLGWECVLYLANRGAGSIVTLSRSKPKQQKLIDMDAVSRKYNCKVISIQADVTVFKEVEASLLQINQIFPHKPLKGVFFGAAVLVDATLVEMTEEKLNRSLSPKVTGLWNVHTLTSELPLDFFVLHSSGAAVLGNAGQSNYGAGNGFMDGLAHCRRHLGMSGQSINWGPLDLGMLDNKQSVLKRLQGQGYMVIENKHIARCLTHMFMLNEPQALMCRIDRQKMAEQLNKDKEKTLLTRLKTYLEPAIKCIENKGNPLNGVRKLFSLQKLKTCSREEGLGMLQGYLKYLVCDKALLDESRFDLGMNMKDQGVDSMYAMEITGDIQTEVGVKMSAHEIQLQSAYVISENLWDAIFNESLTDKTDVNKNEKIISKSAITASIAKSVCGFSYESDFNMGFVIVSTINLPDIVETQTIIESVKTCLSRHRITRTTWTFSKESVTTNELSLDKALDFRIISGCQADEVKLHTEEPIKLSIQGPLRFIFLVKRKQLRMVFHKFAFDLKAITTFVREFESLASAKLNGIPTDEIHFESDKDIAEEIQNNLAPIFESICQFWKMKTAYLPYNSFSSSPALHLTHDILVTKSMDKEMYSRVLKFSKQQSLTIFELFVGIFQFLLATVSNNSVSVTTISIDLRSHVPALTKSLGRCTNFIPLIFQLPENTATVEVFFQKYKKETERLIKHSLLPSEEIKKGIPESCMRNFETNYFIFEDDVMTNEHNKLKVDMPVIFGPFTETFFYIWHKKATQTFEIRFHLKKELFTKFRAEALTTAFVNLVDDVIRRPELTLGELVKQKYMAMEEMCKVSSACSIL